MKPSLLGVPLIGEHLGAVRVPFALLIALCVDQRRVPQPAAFACLAGVPPDAELLRVEPSGQGLLCIFRHPSFPSPLADGRVAEIAVQRHAYPLQIAPSGPVQ